MAEHAAHLTSARLSDPTRPSVFEVLAQENLTATIRPAFKHIVKVMADKYPAQLGPFLRFYDEIFLSLDALVQHHYLKVWGASFAENFYGMQRVPSEENSGKDPSGSGSRIRSLACLVLIPYLRTKLDAMFEDLQYKYPSIKWKSLLQANLSLQQRLSALYLCVYPHVRSSWEFVSLLYQMSYMLRGGRWHSPGLHLSGMELAQRMDDDDNRDGGGVGDSHLDGRLTRFLKLSATTAAACLSYSVSVSVFFLQFLEWWYATDAHAPSLTALPIPHPPQALQSKAQDSLVPGQCPVCYKPVTNSTALSVSGYVFCYPCINGHVRDHHSCPVTGYPATTDHLVKIYQPDT